MDNLEEHPSEYFIGSESGSVKIGCIPNAELSPNDSEAFQIFEEIFKPVTFTYRIKTHLYRYRANKSRRWNHYNKMRQKNGLEVFLKYIERKKKNEID